MVCGRLGAVVTVLAGEVQQWRDGRWRTVLTAAGTAVNDQRRHPYHNPGGDQVLFGFDGASDGTTVLFHNGRIYQFPGGPT